MVSIGRLLEKKGRREAAREVYAKATTKGTLYSVWQHPSELFPNLKAT